MTPLTPLDRFRRLVAEAAWEQERAQEACRRAWRRAKVAHDARGGIEGWTGTPIADALCATAATALVDATKALGLTHSDELNQLAATLGVKPARGRSRA